MNFALWKGCSLGTSTAAKRPPVGVSDPLIFIVNLDVAFVSGILLLSIGVAADYLMASIFLCDTLVSRTLFFIFRLAPLSGLPYYLNL